MLSEMPFARATSIWHNVWHSHTAHVHRMGYTQSKGERPKPKPSTKALSPKTQKKLEWRYFCSIVYQWCSKISTHVLQLRHPGIALGSRHASGLGECSTLRFCPVFAF